MSDLKELPYFCNFAMLTQKLHILFKEYIVCGRRRAPPEWKLMDLISTFQFGAKTDRRALQSKFKSWSRRMFVENNTLRLLSSSKEIIPVEKCKELVLMLHFHGHISVDKVISKIQERFTWTRKNFGMDRFMVMNIISSNCPDPVCNQNIATVIPKREPDFMQDVVTSTECHLQTVLKQCPSTSNNNAAFLNPAMSMYAWPVMFPVPNSEKLVPFNFQKNDMLSYEKYNKPCYNNKPKCMEIHKIQPANSQNQRTHKTHLYEMKRQLRSANRKKVFGSDGTFRKPKYIHEFKALVSAAEKLSSAYPSILNDSKTKFLGSLDLVPKKICSKKTLSKFEREKKKKKTLERQHMYYHKHRKNLRDRNKLNKIKQKQQQQKPPYLDITKARRSSLNFTGEPYHDKTTEADYVSRDSDVEILEVVPKAKPEIIQISSSEDEKFSNSIPSGLSQNKIGITLPQPLFDCSVGKTIEHYKSPYSEMNRKGRFVNKISIKKTIDGSYTTKMPASSDLNQTSSGMCKVHSFSKNSTIPYKSKSAILPSPLAPLGYLKPSEMPADFKGFHKKKVPELFSNQNVWMPQSPGNCNIVTVKKEIQNFSNFYPIPKIPADTSLYLIEKSVFDKSKTLLPGSSVLPRPVDILNFKTPNEKLSGINSGTSNSNVKTWNKIVTNKKVDSPHQILRLRRRMFSEEMSKFVWWIRKTKMSVMHTLTHNNIERSTLRLKSQMNTGIALVKNLRRRLIEIENLEAIHCSGNYQNYLDGNTENF